MTSAKLTKEHVRRWLPSRKRISHKGDYGHVLVIAGSKGMSGAGVLCALGALRGGAGLVTLAMPKSLLPAVTKKIRPEAMTLLLPETKVGAISEKAFTPVLNFIEKRRITAIAAGPGISRGESSKRFVQKLLMRLCRIRSPGPEGIVLDADGFLALSTEDGTSILKKTSLPLIVTPHPGEMAKFCGVSTSSVQRDRAECAQKFAKLNGVVCVLKGAGTVVSDGHKTFVNTTGNPGMATGGSGDVLTGLIAALIPQISGFGIPNPRLLRAAAAGVFIHGLAGDLARKEKTEIAMIAGDIAEKIPDAINAIL
jgi:NAD(P)H-hydrate epimerase